MLTDEDFVMLTRAAKEWAREACAGRLVSCSKAATTSDLGATVAAHVAPSPKIKVDGVVVKPVACRRKRGDGTLGVE